MASAAQALPGSGTNAIFAIHHEDYGEVGEHNVMFSEESGDLVVSVKNNITVKLLVFTAYRFEAKRREVWRDGRMIAYESQTNDDGTDIAVAAKIEGDKLLIDGPEGRVEAPAGTFPTHPWNAAILKETLLMDSKTGSLLRVAVSKVGLETLELSKGQIKATKYQVTGDQERELWFDQERNLVKIKLFSDGKAVTLTRR